MVEGAMSATLGKVLLLGLPLVLSLAWSAFWIIKLLRAAKKARRQAPGAANRPQGKD